MTTHDTLIEGLKARRAKLVAELRDIEDALDDPPSRDWEDRSAERQGDEVLEALGNSDLAEMRRIDAALARDAAGTFGICTQCGEQISAARLETLPETPFCKTCAAQQG